MADHFSQSKKIKENYTATIHEKEKAYTDQINSLNEAIGYEKQAHLQDKKAAEIEAEKLRKNNSHLNELINSYKKELSSGELARANETLQSVQASLKAAMAENAMLKEKANMADKANEDLHALCTKISTESDKKTEQIHMLDGALSSLRGQQKALTQELQRLYSENIKLIAAIAANGAMTD